MTAHLINKLINYIFNKRHKPKNMKNINPDFYKILKNNGEGLYYINLKGSSTSIVSKEIEKYSGGLTHCMWFLYSEDLKKYFSIKQWKKISKKWNFYYGDTFGVRNSCKGLVLGSADKTGMNFFDIANYQGRQFSLRKPKLTKAQEFGIINWLLKDENMYNYYDYVGLFFWPLNKLLRKIGIKNGFRSNKDYFCSEQLHYSLKYIGINLFPNFDNPSPKEIEDVKKEWIVYKTNKFPY